MDVVADIDPESETFGKYVAVEWDSNENKQLWIPKQYAHGFLVLSESANFLYKCSEFYLPEDESGVSWNDPTLNIDWPIKNPIVSEKDKRLPTLTRTKWKY